LRLDAIAMELSQLNPSILANRDALQQGTALLAQARDDIVNSQRALQAAVDRGFARNEQGIIELDARERERTTFLDEQDARRARELDERAWERALIGIQDARGNTAGLAAMVDAATVPLQPVQTRPVQRVTFTQDKEEPAVARSDGAGPSVARSDGAGPLSAAAGPSSCVPYQVVAPGAGPGASSSSAASPGRATSTASTGAVVD
jgi:hypothetical protein